MKKPHQTYISTMVLQVPPYDWPLVKRGEKREFRRLNAGGSRLRKAFLPLPVWAYSETAAREEGQMMILEGLRLEPVGSISDASIAAEGFANVEEFKHYWMLKTGERPRLAHKVQVVNVRPWGDDDDALMASQVLKVLYGHLQ